MGFHQVSTDPFPSCIRCECHRTLSLFAIPKQLRQKRLGYDDRPGMVGERYELCRVCRDYLNLPEEALDRVPTEVAPKLKLTKEAERLRRLVDKERVLYKERQERRSAEERRSLSRPYVFQAIKVGQYRRAL